MFTHFFGPTRSSSRFEKCTEFKPVFSLLKELYKKNNELEKEAKKNGASSIEYLKNSIISKLVKKININIQKFDIQPTPSNQTDEMNDMIKLANELIENIMQVLTTEKKTLLIPRNNQRQMVNTALDIATVGGSVAAAIISAPMPLIAVPAAFLGSSFLSHYTRSAIGINNIAPRSACILFEIVGHLILINRNISLNLGLATERYDALIAEVMKMCEEITSSELNANQANYTENVGVTQAATSSKDNGLLHSYSEATQDYVDNLRKKKTHSDIIEELKLTEEEGRLFDDYTDRITEVVMNIPVRIHGASLDIDTILKLPVDQAGQRKDPFNNYKFYLRDLQPDWETSTQIQSLIEKIKKDRSNQVEQEKPHEETFSLNR